MEVGLAPEVFGHLTPRLIAAAFRGKGRAAVTAHRNMAWSAWHTAVLPLAKRIPSLEKFGGAPPKPKPKPQTPNQQLAVAQLWAARGVGTIQ